jgi:4-hydroxyphenylacetate 3-monooxygenase
LLQEYFLVACAVRDILKRFRRRHDSQWALFPEKVAIQLNDTHPALTIAELYALQHQPDLQDRLSFVLDASGERIGYSHIQPKTVEDLRRRREMIALWADWNGGMLGRTPDFMNMMLAGYAAAHEYFAQGGPQFGDNVRRYQDRQRREDLCLTHTLIHPQRDRSTAAPVAADEEERRARRPGTDAGA